MALPFLSRATEGSKEGKSTKWSHPSDALMRPVSCDVDRYVESYVRPLEKELGCSSHQVNDLLDSLWPNTLDTILRAGKLCDDWEIGMSLQAEKLFIIELEPDRKHESMLWALARMPVSVMTLEVIKESSDPEWYDEMIGNNDVPPWVLKPEKGDHPLNRFATEEAGWISWPLVMATTIPLAKAVGDYVEGMWSDIASTDCVWSVWWSNVMSTKKLPVTAMDALDDYLMTIEHRTVNI